MEAGDLNPALEAPIGDSFFQCLRTINDQFDIIPVFATKHLSRKKYSPVCCSIAEEAFSWMDFGKTAKLGGESELAKLGAISVDSKNTNAAGQTVGTMPERLTDQKLAAKRTKSKFKEGILDQ